MSTFVLIPGAGGMAWYWHRLVPELERRGHEALAVDLPADDETAGFRQYTDAVLAAIGARRSGLVVVASSMGSYTGARVCSEVPVDLLVLLNAMVPLPGESGGEWWEATGQGIARAERAAQDHRELDDDDVIGDFFHDVPPDVTATALAKGELRQSSTPFAEPDPVPAWPDVPTRVLVGRDDRFFPAVFQRRIAAERLGLETDVMPGGHLLALSRPSELADRLVGYVNGVHH